jgi:hypothetical protein
MASPTSGGPIPAAQGPGSPTAAVPAADQFPAPSSQNATADSPLAQTVPLAAGAQFHIAISTPPAPGQVAVYRPLAQEGSLLDQLRVFGFALGTVRSQSESRLVVSVTAGGHSYLADYQPTSFGYHLKLTLTSPVSTTAPAVTGFDPESSARAFLSRYQLTVDGLQPDGVVTQPDGIKVAQFSEYYPNKMVGAYATVTFNAHDVLMGLDVQWVDTSVGPSAPGVPFTSALVNASAGNGLIHTGASTDLTGSTLSVTGTTILYVQVSAPEGIYYEPVYQISGATASGSAFEIYVPVVDQGYLR